MGTKDRVLPGHFVPKLVLSIHKLAVSQSRPPGPFSSFLQSFVTSIALDFLPIFLT